MPKVLVLRWISSSKVSGLIQEYSSFVALYYMVDFDKFVLDRKLDYLQRIHI